MARQRKVKGSAMHTSSRENVETTPDATVIPVAQEHLQVKKRQIVRGKVKLHKTIEERLETVTIPLHSERVDITRVPKDEFVSEAQSPRQEGDTLILPIYEEVVVVEKRLRLVEEVHVSTKRSQREDVQEVLLRLEKMTINRDGQEVVP